MARKILLADDSVTAQNMGRKILADAGYEVITVNNGSAALKKIAELKPDLIVLDVYMPGYSGLEVCQRLKEAQETSRIPVLLTVGKLEPFKPEEAKRVRAEGFIVKPFEASELLAALAKLEDKIVPRSEASKPGRFARANAALDEGRYDKSVAIDEDSGWKNRIGFPSKKKKAAAEEESDESTIYNAVNKDLRTVVERKIVQGPQEAQPEEPRVDLGALGLPKDVTPEEIAALAAAAAQVKGKMAEDFAAEPAPPPIEARVEDVKTEAKSEAPVETTKESPSAAAPVADEPKPEAPAEVLAEKVSDIPRGPVSVPTPSPADVMAAIAGLEPGMAASADTGSGEGSNNESNNGSNDGSNSHVAEPVHEPATMAVGAGSEFRSAASRWIAVPVALGPDETSISLEQEMQKTYAAFAAAEVAQIEPVATVAEIPAAETPAAIHPPAFADAPLATPAVIESAASVPELAPAESRMSSISAAVNAATHVMSAVVRDFERVIAPQSEPPAPAAVEPEAAPVSLSEAQPTSVPSEPPSIEAKTEELPAVAALVPEPESAPGEPAKQDEPAPAVLQPIEYQRQEAIAEQKVEDAVERIEAAQPEEQAPTAAVTPAPAEESSAIEVEKPVQAAAIASEISSDRASIEADSAESTTAAHSDSHARAGKKESDIAETTAAAWASWRRIRESGDAKGNTAQSTEAKMESQEEASAPKDTAAMAVAAGAEKAPEEGPAADEDSGDIANIVDSVLADMRPKIVEEISRKMKKKK